MKESNKHQCSMKMNLDEIQKNYERIELDLGTGDGRFVYKKALKNPETFYIGIDPSHKQLKIYSKKAVRKKLENVLFLRGSAESLPKNLNSFVSTLYIILPWGSLLQYIATPNTQILKNIIDLLKHKGILEIIFGYVQEREPTETARLGLGILDSVYIENILIPKYGELDLVLEKSNTLTKKELREFESTWSKKLGFGKERPLFHLKFRKE